MFARIAIEQYEYRDYPHLGIVLQSYLRDTDLALEGLLGWTKDEGLPFSIRKPPLPAPAVNDLCVHRHDHG